MTLTPAQNGFVKGLGLVLLLAAVSFLSNSANLDPITGHTIAVLVAAIFSSIESHIRDKTGDGLLGAVSVR